jgi:hypothetical protein
MATVYRANAREMHFFEGYLAKEAAKDLLDSQFHSFCETVRGLALSY